MMLSVTSWRRSRLTEALADLIVGPSTESRVPGSPLRSRSPPTVLLPTSQAAQYLYRSSCHWLLHAILGRFDRISGVCRAYLNLLSSLFVGETIRPPGHAPGGRRIQLRSCCF